MKAYIYKTSDFYIKEPFIREINTLDDLLNICKEYGKDIVVSFDKRYWLEEEKKYDLFIEIYDDYRE